MTARSRESRRRSRRTPGIWRGPEAPPESGEYTPVQHGTQGSSDLLGWRAFSGVVILCLAAVLLLFFSADAFYVRSIAVGGAETISKEEVFALTDIANTHIFWVDPAVVRENVLRSPTIADATVQVGWPPNMVQVVIQERQPALVWEQSGVLTWLDLQGRVMLHREDRPNLLQVTDIETEGPLGPNQQVDPQIVAGALQLKTLYPNLPDLRYHPDKGLGYQDGRGWDVWFGAGTDMPQKILVYDAIVNNLVSRGIQPGEINVMNPDAPFYSVTWGR
jgi:hypothetical protein